MSFVDGQRRFLIRRDLWLQPLLFVVGAARDSNSYVAIEEDRLRVRFGWFFNETFALSDIEDVETMRWPWYYGLGWRSDLVGLVGLVASFHGVIAVRFRQRQRVAGIIPFMKLRCDRLAVSLREPEELIAVLTRAVSTS